MTISLLCKLALGYAIFPLVTVCPRPSSLLPLIRPGYAIFPLVTVCPRPSSLLPLIRPDHARYQRTPEHQHRPCHPPSNQKNDNLCITLTPNMPSNAPAPMDPTLSQMVPP